MGLRPPPLTPKCPCCPPLWFGSAFFFCFGWSPSAAPSGHGRTAARLQDPILAYTAEAEINTLHWSALQTDWISICFGKKVQILRV